MLASDEGDLPILHMTLAVTQWVYSRFMVYTISVQCWKRLSVCYCKVPQF